jgi:hypothetical protein
VIAAVNVVAPTPSILATFAVVSSSLGEYSFFIAEKLSRKSFLELLQLLQLL